MAALETVKLGCAPRKERKWSGRLSAKFEMHLGMMPEGERGCIREIVYQCCDQQTSWIALGETGDVVGFLLGEEYSRIGRRGMEFEGVSLPYGGVLMEHRGHRYFSGLLDRAKTIKISLHSIMKQVNKSDRAAGLVKKGFIEMPNFPCRLNEDVLSQSLLAIVAPSQELINRGLFQAVYEIRRKVTRKLGYSSPPNGYPMCLAASHNRVLAVPSSSPGSHF